MPAVEDNCELLDLSNIIAESKTENHAIVFAGTDYGVCKMSETVAITSQVMAHHFDRYDVLDGKSTAAKEDVTCPKVECTLRILLHAVLGSSEQVDLEEKEANRNKKSMTITANLVNDVSHTTVMLKNRERRLQDNPIVTQSLQDVSEASKAQHSSLTMESIDTTQAVRRLARTPIRRFEWSKQQRKAKHHQQLRTKRAISKLCAAERRFVAQSHVQPAGTSSHYVI